MIGSSVLTSLGPVRASGCMMVYLMNRCCVLLSKHSLQLLESIHVTWQSVSPCLPVDSHHL